MVWPTPADSSPEALAAYFGGFRTRRDTAALPASIAAPIFMISIGRILLLGIVGEVTTVIQTQPNNAKLVCNPTVGANLDICADLDITDDPVGLLYGITGTFANPLIGSGTAVPWPQRRVVLPPGTLDLSCAATSTGSVKWDLYWVPLDDGASAVAA